MVWDDLFEDLFRDLERMRRRMLKGFSEPEYLGRGFKPVERWREPISDVWETEKEVVIALEIPGVKKENLDLNVTEEEVEVRGKLKSEIEKERESSYFSESRYLGFYKKISLPAKVKPEKAKATFENGVLEIRIPKKEEQKGFKVTIS